MAAPTGDPRGGVPGGFVPGGFVKRILDALRGRAIRNDEDEVERVGPLRGVGILGLDALGSAAYGPEALLTALLPLGAGAVRYVQPITLVIIVILVIVALSYSQIIREYPEGGGAYHVARSNIGTRASLLAAAALILDYLLNVAVAISAGIGALVSAVPALLPHTLGLCLGVLVLLTLINLRGVRSTGLMVVIPTYLFLSCLFTVMGLGLFTTSETAATAGPSRAASAQPTATLWWLLLGAFAHGCSAMTGIEAVSNGVPLFEKPSVVGARRTLFLLASLLGSLLIGVALLTSQLGIVATEPDAPGYESVLSQLTTRIVGRGPLYYVTIASVITVLALSANTSFAGFPRVCQLLARDQFLPEPFLQRGRRLVFSHGIWLLALCSGILLVLFGGVTDRLIPLFAIGALFAFTMSQAGMVGHWRARTGPRARVALIMNGLGACATGLTLLVVLVSKFHEGAWMSVVLAGGMVLLFTQVRRHYDFIARATATDDTLELGPQAPPIVVVPMRRWDAISLKALRLAVTLSPDVFVIQITTGDRAVDDLAARWSELVRTPAAEQQLPQPRLIVRRSEYRRLLEPLVDAVLELAQRDTARAIAVVIPELIEPRWYQQLLHGHTAALLKHELRARGEPRVVIINTPWYLRDWLPERRWLRLGRRPRVKAPR